MAAVKVHNPITGTMKAVAVVGVLGVLAYDGIQLGVHRVNAEDTANSAAHAAEDVIFQNGSDPCAAAVSYATDHGVTMTEKDCVVNQDRTVDVVIRATAQKIVIGRFKDSLVSFRVKGHADRES